MKINHNIFATQPAELKFCYLNVSDVIQYYLLHAYQLVNHLCCNLRYLSLWIIHIMPVNSEETLDISTLFVSPTFTSKWCPPQYQRFCYFFPWLFLFLIWIYCIWICNLIGVVEINWFCHNLSKAFFNFLFVMFHPSKHLL